MNTLRLLPLIIVICILRESHLLRVGSLIRLTGMTSTLEEDLTNRAWLELQDTLLLCIGTYFWSLITTHPGSILEIEFRHKLIEPLTNLIHWLLLQRCTTLSPIIRIITEHLTIWKLLPLLSLDGSVYRVSFLRLRYRGIRYGVIFWHLTALHLSIDLRGRDMLYRLLLCRILDQLHIMERKKLSLLDRLIIIQCSLLLLKKLLLL